MLKIASITEKERQGLLNWALERHVDAREPDFRVMQGEDVYLERWYVVRSGCVWSTLTDEQRRKQLENDNPREDDNRENVYIHRFLRGDDDRALHDHPWAWETILLDGEYLEIKPVDDRVPLGAFVTHHRHPGDRVTSPNANSPHRIKLIAGQPALTFFITGARTRDWGFWCDQGWTHWREFTAMGAHGQSRGCG